MYMRNSSKKRKYLIVKLFGTRSCDGSLYVCSCRYNGCINRRDVHIIASFLMFSSCVFLPLLPRTCPEIRLHLLLRARIILPLQEVFSPTRVGLLERVA